MTTTTTETKATARTIVIHSKGDIIDFDKINLNDWNPNFVSTTIMNAIKDDIVKNGFLEVIVLQKHNKRLKKDYVIINGEHRYLALMQLWKDGYKLVNKQTGKKIFGVPSTVIDVNDKTAKALTIRLNREHGDLMPDKVGAIIKDISPNIDISYINDMLFLPETEILVLADMAKTIQEQQEQKQKQKTKGIGGGGGEDDDDNSSISSNGEDDRDNILLDSPEAFLNRDVIIDDDNGNNDNDDDEKAAISTKKTTTCPQCGNTFLIASS